MSIISQNSSKNLVKQAQACIISKGWAVIPGVLSLNPDGSKKVDLRSQYWNKDEEKGLDDPFLVPEVFKNKNALGIVTGFRSGITVLDLDVDKKTGKTFTPLAAFPPTYTVKTQSGGYHLYYKYYSDISNKTNVGGEKYPKVDCRNDGGFVFAPPTEIDGKQAYEVIDDREPEPFPSELFSDIKASKKNTNQYKGIKALKTFQGMEQGERDTALFTFAFFEYKSAPMKDWPTVDLAVQLMNTQMKTPLSEGEVTKIINSAKKYQKAEIEAKGLDLVKTPKGQLKLELRNVAIILREDPEFKGKIRANTFAGTIEYYSDNEWHVIQKSNETMLRMELADKYPFMGDMPKAHVEDAIAVIATENRVSPIAEHFKTLTWDQKPRLHEWIHKTYNVEQNAYYEEMGHHYLVGLVNRVMRPGCQMDNAIVLDGTEGFGKSQSLRALCEFEGLGTLFNETSESPDGKDFAISLLGSIITEFAEGAVFDFRDRKKVKSFMSKVSDKYRPPYERAALDFPRQGVFAMSTNDSQYLEDRGINRRWWPVVLNRAPDMKANIDWLRENKEQLYAEAMTKIRDDYWSFSPEAQTILNMLREDKKIEDETHIPILEWYASLPEEAREEGITKIDGWKKLDFKKDPSDFELKKIGEFYTEILHLNPTRKRINGIFKRVFVPTPQTPAPVDELVEENKEVNNF